MVRHLLSVASSSPPLQYDPTQQAKPVVRTHWRLFAGVFFACLALVMLATLILPKRYTATVKLLVGSIQTAAGAKGNALSYNTIVDVVREGTVVKRVIDTLKLDEKSAQLRDRIKVNVVPNTPIVGLSATSRSPEQAAAIANTFAAALIDRDRELAGARGVAAQAHLQTALYKAQNALQQADSVLATYQAKNAAESKLATLIDDREQAEAQLRNTLAQIAVVPPTVAGEQITDVNPAFSELRQQLSETETQLATARTRYTDQNPALISLERQRNALLRQVGREPGTVAGRTIAVPNPIYQQLSQQAATLRSNIAQDIVQIAELQHRREALVPTLAALPTDATELQTLQERAATASDVYKALQQKYDDAVVAADSAVSDVTVAQPAEPDDVTVSPNVVFNAVAGIVFGLISALFAVAIANYLKRRNARKDDVESALDGPVAGRLLMPYLQTGVSGRLPQLDAALKVLQSKSGNRAIVITGQENADALTTIPYDVAAAMSQIVSRVLLVDADMRSASIYLSEILSGQRRLDQAVVHYTGTLDVLTVGSPSPNSHAISDSQALDKLIDLTGECYDCVIVDKRVLVPSIDGYSLKGSLERTRADGADVATLKETLDALSERLDRLSAQIVVLSGRSGS